MGGNIMARKLGVSVSEMLHMREQGLSNKDIANLLEISYPTVLRYIGPQGGAHGRFSGL